MLDKRFWATVSAIAVTSALAVFFVNTSGNSTGDPQPEAVAGFVADIPAHGPSEALENPPESYAYLLAEHNGHIAVFAPGQIEPQIVLDVLVKFLPDYDRAMLAKGIPVADYAALSALIEDFIS